MSMMILYIWLTALQLSPCHGAAVQHTSRGPHLDERQQFRSSYLSEEAGSGASYHTVNPQAIRNITTGPTFRVVTKVVATGTIQILPTPTIRADTVGTIHTLLETAGGLVDGPLLTSEIPTPTTIISTVRTMVIKLATSMEAATVDNDIFEAPIATSAPPSSIVQRSDHPVPRLGIQQTSVISTNKFYQNFFLGSQGSTTVVHPYSVAWAKGQGVAQSWGLAISHIDANQLAFGPTNSYGATNFFINPIGIQSLVLSASELGSSTSLTTTHITDMSAVVQLRASAASAPVIEFPLVQGSGFITAEYEGATPIIQTGVFFLTVTKVNTEPRPGVTKYKIKLNDGKDWLLYAYSTSGSPLELQVVNNGLIRAKSAFTGTIQVAKDPGNGEALYDAASGQYATGVSLSATARGMRGTYTFNFEKAGLVDAPLLMFALPHHVQSFDDTTAAAVKSGLQLQTTTKGIATAVVADTWTLVEPRLPISMSFVPWTSYEGSKKALSEAEKARILKVARLELSQDIGAQTNLNSMYFSGKALAKFAMILAVVYDMLGDSALAAAGLEKLKAAFAVFASNKQIFPLTYESAWGGIVSSASYQTGDSGADFGNTYYNDHHFHYGYHVLAAAVIAHLDPKWLDANKDYVNTLVRDFANPSAKDTWFPQNRMFDWYHGHSFAHGLYESADGRDQESSSEDTMASYALKMWGLVSGDANMAARGNLQLSVLARSANNYFLYTSGNTIQPANFIGNKVAGILFENKIDHTTYFGANIEYIQGIHMLPLIPATQLVRGQDFVAEEWDQYFNAGRADKVDGGWRGVLYGNLATIDPKAAFDFFSKDGFDQSWLDGGASLTWYLAYSAALAGL